MCRKDTLEARAPVDDIRPEGLFTGHSLEVGVVEAKVEGLLLARVWVCLAWWCR
jgi:hypothetical protein